MNKQLIAVVALSLVVAFVGSAVAQAGMMGGQMPMTPEFAARMMNACLGAMEGMAPMGQMMRGMMGSQRGPSQTPSEQKQ